MAQLDKNAYYGKMAKYTVYLFGERFEHRSIEAARKRAIDALNYCQPPHNQIIDESGKQVSIFPPQDCEDMRLEADAQDYGEW